MYYSTAIFKSAGFVQGNHAIYATIALGGVNVLATIVTVFLVERVGRKVLLLIGYLGMAVLMISLTICLLQTVSGEIEENKSRNYKIKYYIPKGNDFVWLCL